MREDRLMHNRRNLKLHACLNYLITKQDIDVNVSVMRFGKLRAKSAKIGRDRMHSVSSRHIILPMYYICR